MRVPALGGWAGALGASAPEEPKRATARALSTPVEGVSGQTGWTEAWDGPTGKRGLPPLSCHQIATVFATSCHVAPCLLGRPPGSLPASPRPRRVLEGITEARPP